MIAAEKSTVNDFATLNSTGAGAASPGNITCPLHSDSYMNESTTAAIPTETDTLIVTRLSSDVGENQLSGAQTSARPEKA
jgi:hypothetical protein